MKDPFVSNLTVMGESVSFTISVDRVASPYFGHPEELILTLQGKRYRLRVEDIKQGTDAVGMPTLDVIGYEIDDNAS